MGRWTQYDEDSYRLPEGVIRIGYDADTSQYTFRDEQGAIYQGAPGANYGTLTRVTSSRPETVKTNKPPRKVSVETTGRSPTTFYDILPPNSITSPSSSADNPPPYSPPTPRPNTQLPGSSTRARFVDAVRKTALPKMQGVVQNLRRSVTMPSKKVSLTQPMGEDGDKLLRRKSQASSEKTSLSRSDSTLRTMPQQGAKSGIKQELDA